MVKSSSFKSQIPDMLLLANRNLLAGRGFWRVGFELNISPTWLQAHFCGQAVRGGVQGPGFPG